MYRILIVDDDAAVTNYLMVFLMQTGQFESTIKNDSREVPDLLDKETFDLVLLDMDMPNISGMDILSIMREKKIDTPVIILTGVSDVDLAVKAMKLAAFDYLTKPVDDEHLLERMTTAIEHQKVTDSIEQMPEELTREDLSNQDAFAHIITQNDGMIRVLHQAERLADADMSVFLTGERGTGKEMLARAIHNSSSRRKKNFVAIDASAQELEKFTGDFFGQAPVWGGDREERSGFLEKAEGGTLYLEEIEHLPLSMQVRILRVLQTSEYYHENSTTILNADVRFIVASSRDLAGPAYQDKFSQDLLYHLMINSLVLPPLRERIEDLPALSEMLLKETLKKINRKITGFSEDFFEMMSQYDSPNNIQGLRTIIEGSVINTENEIVTAESLPVFVRQRVAALARGVTAGFRPMTMVEAQVDHAEQMIAYYENDRAKAAVGLKITPDALDTLLGNGS
jgi:two-component system, NtrC family, response regulator